MPARLFFSYSHKDEDLRDQLETHLSTLKRQGLLETWHDRRITAGDEIDSAIMGELERADIILFLVSPDFIASDYCYDMEVRRALERHEQREARTIPVILRPCDWHPTPFGKLLGTPTDGKAITRWPDRDEAFLGVTLAIRKAVEGMGKAVDAPPAPAAAPVPAMAAPSARSGTAAGLRSSNLRVAKTFTQRDRADFLDDTFEFIAKFFEGSLSELEKRNPGIETRFRKIDADRFTAVVYRGGQQVSACTVFRGGLAGGGTQICYSMNENAATNGFNEAISVEHDEQSLFLKMLGMSHMLRGNGRETKLSQEGAAEAFWSILMEPLQRG